MSFRAATAAELASNSDVCAVCLEDMDAARRLPCGHVFHAQCLREWIPMHAFCPTCRCVCRRMQRPLDRVQGANHARPARPV